MIVREIVFDNKLLMMMTMGIGNPMPDSTLTLQYARVDFIPRSRLRIWPQKKSEACTINYTDDKDWPARKFSGINLPSLQKRTVYICRGAGGEWRKSQDTEIAEKSLLW